MSLPLKSSELTGPPGVAVHSWSTPGGCPRYADHAATWTYTRAGFLSAVPVARVWCRNCQRVTSQMITDRRELNEVATELGLAGVR